MVGIYLRIAGRIRTSPPVTAAMETAKSDINDVWRKLKQTQPGGRSVSFEKLWHGFSSDISSGKASKPVNKSSRGELEYYLQKTINSRQAQAYTPITQPSATDISTSLGEVALDRLLTSLTSPEASTRRVALQQIKAIYAPPGEIDTSADAAVAEVFNSKIGKGLLRRFDDKVESCREIAVVTFSRMLQRGPDATLTMLPYAMPVLEERLHFDEVTRNPTECSEEVRLLLVQLLSIVLGQAGSAVAAYASEVWSMLSAALADNHHEVAMQGCKVAQQLAGTLGLRLGSTAKDIVSALLPLTTHKRHRVRTAAVEAIRDVMHQGAHEMILEMVAWRDPNCVPIKAFYGDDLKVNFCGKLATDQHVQVRLAFLHMVGNWMLTLRERTDHEARLLPYVLSGLCDESPLAVQAALQLLDQLGQQYEREHEKDLQDAVRFAAAAADASEARFLAALRAGTAVYPLATAPDVTGAAVSGAGSGSADAAGIGTAAPATFHLPGPFTSRPRLGSRLLVRNNFGSSLTALCGDLSSWQSGPREMSAALLMINLAVAESAAERHLQVLLPALCHSIRDAAAAESVANCAALLGCHCDLALVMNLLTPQVTDSADADSRKQADALLVLAAILRGTGPLVRVQGHSQTVLKLLQQPGISDSQDTSIKAAATAVMQQLLRPGVVQQLLVDDGDAYQQQQLQQSTATDGSTAIGVHSSDISCSSMRASNELLMGCVHVLLQLAACGTSVLGSTAAAGSNEAAVQAQAIEQLLEQLAAAAGYCGVDHLLGLCRQQLLNQFVQQLDLHCTAAVAVVCRLLLPIACSWVLTASAAATAKTREPINSTTCLNDWLLSSSNRSFGSASALPAVSDGCEPGNLLTLLKLVTAAEQTYSKHAQHTPASVHLLQLTLDCCMALWPVDAFSRAVLQQLVQNTVPALLSSSHSLAAMTGLRALHHAVLRGLLGSAESSEDKPDDTDDTDTEKQQQRQQGRQVLLEAWQKPQGLCHGVCRLLQSHASAVRLEVCFLVQSVLGVLGGQLLLQHENVQQGVPVSLEAVPQPAAALAAALEDADADVRAAARSVLHRLVTQASQRSTPESKATWMQKIQHQMGTAT